jgi:hypothetical protein
MNKLTLNSVLVSAHELGWVTPEKKGITEISIIEFDNFEEFCSICDPLFMSQKGKELVWYNQHNNNEQPHLKRYYPKSIHAFKDIEPALMENFLKTFKGVDQTDNPLSSITFSFGDVAQCIQAKAETGKLIYLPNPNQEVAQVVMFIPKDNLKDNLKKFGWVINKTTIIIPSYYFIKI